MHDAAHGSANVMKREMYWGLVALCWSAVGGVSAPLSPPGEPRDSQPQMADREVAGRIAVTEAAHLEPGAPRKLQALLRLGAVLREEQKFSEAEIFYRQALAECRAVLGENSPNTA